MIIGDDLYDRGFVEKYTVGFDKVENPPLNRYDMLEGGFTSIVYTVTDNALHPILMWGAYQIIY